MRRILAIGDIHGYYDKFIALYRKLKVNTKKDKVVFLGDYTDRGYNSGKVMELVMEHVGEPHITFLMGNHELMLCNALENQKDYGFWFVHGGKETLHSIGSDNDFLRKWAETVKQFPAYADIKTEEKHFVFCHAGIDPQRDLARQPLEILLWDGEFAESGYHGEYTVVVGHTPVQTYFDFEKEKTVHPMIKNAGHIIMMDTGVFLPQGRLSCMDVLSGKVWSV